MSIQIPKQVTDFLEIPNDMGAFAMAAFKRCKKHIVVVHNRVVTRTGITTVDVDDADPKKAGKQKGRISTRASSRDSSETLAAKVLGLAYFAGKGHIYADEAVRYFSGQKPGTSKSLDEDADYDSSSFAELERALSEGRSLDPWTLNPKMPRGLFGIDDAIIITIIIPLLIAVLPFVLPTLIEWGKGAIALISGVTNQPTGETAAGPPLGDQSIVDSTYEDTIGTLLGGPGDGDPTNDMKSWAIIAGVVVLAVILYRKAT